MATDTISGGAIRWQCLPFDELRPDQLYEILRLRSEVFVLEQNCLYQDMDRKDAHADHLMAWGDGKLLACSRILPPGISYPEPSIGRVVTAPEARGIGLGRALMKNSIQLLHNKFGKIPIKIGAQYYLVGFYESLGFSVSGDLYLEDGIEHVEMTFDI